MAGVVTCVKPANQLTGFALSDLAEAVWAEPGVAQNKAQSPCTIVPKRRRQGELAKNRLDEGMIAWRDEHMDRDKRKKRGGWSLNTWGRICCQVARKQRRMVREDKMEMRGEFVQLLYSLDENNNFSHKGQRGVQN